ncbi:DUF1631 family protein [Roseateles violae]|uniref:DUF1631 family protein n=1 Tax=Roseateles violae TaxID=3058042 RepID=A0ABT8DVK0_9BURK|nr:DUF1631 family protein [Pelomonas sp. PFR6]MDN3922178.1 DUF1631 family protein [Pelomonas sp. PFR6]
MNAPDPRLNPHLDAALQRIRAAAEQAAERCAEGLGLSALSAGQIKRRDALLSAQFLFRKQQAAFGQGFHQSLRRQLMAEQGQLAPEPAAAPKKAWTELSLMDDDAVDALVAADRIGLAIGHHSEWELREVESYVAGLSSGERNPLRPELIGQALLEGVQAVSDDASTRQVLIDELTRALAQEMRSCYADIAELLRSRGLRPQDLRVRGADSGGGHSMHSSHGAHSTRSQPLGRSQQGDYGSGHGGASVHGGHGGGYGGQDRRGSNRGIAAGGLGSVDAQMMDLLRRLAQVPAGGVSATGGYTQPGDFGAPGLAAAAEAGGAMHWQAAPPPPNLIHLHREELRQAATGRLDHMVIDVVGSLFDQILADPKVPPQMARLLARLQLPVLRVALGDPSFFSSRRHPVRRFVNRMASLACAFDDFSEEPGQSFLAHVRELVQDVANGDFDRMDVYESKLDALEAFIAEQTARALKAQGDAAALLERKETDLRLQQRYMQQLQQALATVPMDGFLRDFLAQVWSQAIVLASREGAPERALRLRQLGRELVMSVQPKGGTAQRQTFLGQLPGLMRTLNEGLDLIAWPESARKAFFGQLLPAHAESLKGQALSALDTNLLVKQLDQVFGCAPPAEQDLPPPSQSAPITVPQDLDMGARLSAEEARSLGLVDEAGVDWNGQVDIDLGAEPPEPALQAVDISIDGLPPVAEAPEPSAGALLIDHLQLGFAYRMHINEGWAKVRLAHISAGRSFFIFTQGSKHQQTVTMTARMLRRLCEAGRLRAFENAYLLERATARARKQLAELSKA